MYVCMYMSILRLSRSRGPVCRRLPIFVAIVVLQALTYTNTYIHEYQREGTSKALLSLSLMYTYVCMHVCTCRNARILVQAELYCICR